MTPTPTACPAAQSHGSAGSTRRIRTAIARGRADHQRLAVGRDGAVLGKQAPAPLRITRSAPAHRASVVRSAASGIRHRKLEGVASNVAATFSSTAQPSSWPPRPRPTIADATWRTPLSPCLAPAGGSTPNWPSANLAGHHRCGAGAAPAAMRSATSRSRCWRASPTPAPCRRAITRTRRGDQAAFVDPEAG